MEFIGITGGIGAGKSRVLKYLKEHCRCEIYLADDVAKELEKPGNQVYRSLVDLLGSEILMDGKEEIDPGKMARMIFLRDDLLSGVNSIVHPAVRKYLLARLSEAGERGDVDFFFVEAALLIETGYGDLVDEMWYVHADREVRVQRLMDTRGYSREKAESIMNKQLSEEEYRLHSDYVIDNSGDFRDTAAELEKKLASYQR